MLEVIIILGKLVFMAFLLLLIVALGCTAAIILKGFIDIFMNK